MRTILKFRFGLAAVLLAGLVASSCAREDVEVDNTALPAKESAIYKHIADHKKERTRAGDDDNSKSETYEGETTN